MLAVGSGELEAGSEIRLPNKGPAVRPGLLQVTPSFLEQEPQAQLNVAA